MDWQIKNLIAILPSFKDIITTTDCKGRHWLIDGNNLKKKNDSIPISDGNQFKLRYREAFGNRIVAAYLSRKYNEEIIYREYTIASTGFETDGAIYTKNNNTLFLVTEHVMAYDHKGISKGNELILNSIFGKIEKGIEYMRGKVLIIYLYNIGEWDPNYINRNIKPTQSFHSIYVIDPYSLYEYGVIQFNEKSFEHGEIHIDSDFNSYSISGKMRSYL